jgi:tripartite-type tricarboxylate transporter receptor subunit TctC
MAAATDGYDSVGGVKRMLPIRYRFVRLLLPLLFGTLLALAAAGARAQGYPSKPIRFIIPYPPGGTVDIIGRVLGDKVSTALGQQVIVENRVGAGGSVATSVVAKSAPDGYTLLVGASAPLASALSLYPNLNYDVMKDLAAITLVANNALLLAANPNVPVNSVKELIALAKAKPGTVKSGVPSAGSIHHLITEQFALATGIKLNIVPYKGEAPTVTDLLGGHLDVAVVNVPAVAQYVIQGKLRPLMVTTRQRSELLPNVPTTAEVGLAGLEADPWFAMMAPAGTPKEIITKLHLEFARILASPEVKKRFTEVGTTAISSTPEETSAFIRDEIVRWAKVVKESGAKYD